MINGFERNRDNDSVLQYDQPNLDNQSHWSTMSLCNANYVGNSYYKGITEWLHEIGAV